MATVRQTSFAAGELDPELHGRTDLDIFGRGAKTVRNFVITKKGAALSRPGTTFVRESKFSVSEIVSSLDPDGLDQGRVRLIPYIFSDGRTYVLELGHVYLRLHTLGRTVLTGGVPYEVVTPWPSYALPFLRYAQSGAVMTITSAASGLETFLLCPAVEITIRIDPTTGAPTVDLVVLYNAAALEVDDENGVAHFLPAKSFSPPTPLFADIDNPLNVTGGFAVVTGSIGAADATHPTREWQWMQTAIIQDPVTGATYETLGVRVDKQWDGADYDGTAVALATDKYVLYPDRGITLRRGASATVAAPTWKILAYFLYRGRGGVFGFVASTTSREFVDLGAAPDFAKQPPQGTHPFLIKKSDGTVGREEFPVAVAFFEARRVFGATVGGTEGVAGMVTGMAPGGTKYGRPATIFCSANSDYYNHDKRVVSHVSGEALEYALATLRREEIRHLVSRDRLVVLTDSRAYQFGGTQLDPLDFDSVNGRAVDDVGSAHVTPLVVDGVVLFVRNKGFGARALVPSSSDLSYQGRDVSEQAKHLFVGSGGSKSIRDWAYAEDPFGVVWAVRGDGALLSMTATGPQAVAWARHDTDGTYESICSVPEGEEDAVYVVVKRTINGAARRFIERMTSRIRRVLETGADPLYLAEPTAKDTDQLYPTDVCLDCACTYSGPAALSLEVAAMGALNHKSVYVVAKGQPVLGPFRVEGTPAQVNLSAPMSGGQGLDDVPATNAVDSIGTPIFVARIGLLYTCDLETLAIRGSPELKQKTVSEVGFELDNAQGVQAGQDFDHLDDWQQREVSDSFSPISAASTLLYTIVDNTWDKNARVVLRQSQPRPVTVVGIAREVVSGD